MKRIWQASFAARKEDSETAIAKLEELQEQLRLTTLATEIISDREQEEPYNLIYAPNAAPPLVRCRPW